MLGAGGGVDFLDCHKAPHIPNKKTRRAIRDTRKGKQMIVPASLADLIRSHRD